MTLSRKSNATVNDKIDRIENMIPELLFSVSDCRSKLFYSNDFYPNDNTSAHLYYVLNYVRKITAKSFVRIVFFF